LPVDDFATDNQPVCRKRGFRRYQCRECGSIGASLLRKRNRELIREAKDVPCADCGMRDHFCVMDFDHRDPSEKDFDLANGSCRSPQKLKDEMAKCDVVCSNCHRKRTYKRQEQARQRGETVGCIVPRGTRISPKTQTSSLPDELTLF